MKSGTTKSNYYNFFAPMWLTGNYNFVTVMKIIKKKLNWPLWARITNSDGKLSIKVRVRC